MPTLDKIIKEKIDRLESVPSSLVESASKSQIQMLKKAEELISQMDILDGKFVFNEKNIQLIEQIGNELKGEIFSEPYIKDLTQFAKEFNNQAVINNDYFYKLIPDFEPNSLYDSVLKSSQRDALNLLSEDSISSEILSPIKKNLLSSVTNGGSFTDTIASIREYATNTEKSDGALTRYVKRVAYDSFAVADRQYTKAISEGLELVFYKYQGGEVADTRCFCEERHGGYYHKKEIQGWGEGKGVGSCGYPWQGMNANTTADTIFSFVGGYNCKHSLLPYITSEVPDKWKDRAIKLGFYSTN